MKQHYLFDRAAWTIYQLDIAAMAFSKALMLKTGERLCQNSHINTF